MSSDVLGLGDWTRTLQQMAARGADLRPVLSVIADDFLGMEREQFASEGGRAEVWKPLADSTIQQRGTAHPILQDTGALAASLTVEGAANAVRELTSDGLLVGTDDPKAAWHQTGTRTMPARRVIDVLPTDRERWADRIARHLVP